MQGWRRKAGADRRQGDGAQGGRTEQTEGTTVSTNPCRSWAGRRPSRCLAKLRAVVPICETSERADERRHDEEAESDAFVP